MIFGKHINKYYLKYFLFFLFGILALLVVNWVQLEIPNIYGQVIDGIADSAKNDPNSLFNNPDNITKLMIELGIIAVLMFVGRFTWRYCIFGVGARIESDIRDDMFSHSLLLSNAYYKHHKTGALMALYTNDLQVIRQSFASGTVMTVDALFLGSMALVKMFMNNWILACFSIIPLSLIAVVSVLVGRIMEKKFKARQQAYENLSDFTQENFSGIAVVKAFVKEVHEIRHFDKINEDNRNKNIDFAKFSTLLNVLLTAIISSIFVILFAGGSYFVINGFNNEEFTTGKMLEFIGYFDAVIWPFMAVAQLINMRAQAKASLSRIDEFLDENVEIVDDEVVNVDKIEGKIEFRNLSFKYPDGSNQVLDNISFTIPKGKMVGILGRTGCGKTTIVDLLLRTYNIDFNQIFIDDIDIMHLPFKIVRDYIGYVPQDNFLFSDTISNNIAFAYESIDEEEVIKASKLADVHNNIIEFQEKYNTILGERGVTLSGGQKQRVSIARAIVKNPAILIFDDSVSAVDTKTEETILKNLKELRKDQTTIMIAHRISTVQNLDFIVVMEEGRIAGIGTHDELLKSCSEYQEIVRLQSLEEAISGGDI